jgi:putative phosphoesterase
MGYAREHDLFVVKTTEHLAVPLTRGGVKLVVVADTHSAPHPRAAELIAREKPDRILHAGDIGDLSVVDQLATIAPTSPVRGNIDVEASSIPDALTIDLVEGDSPLFRILMLHIAVNGPKLRADAAKRAHAAEAQLVVCGHSHVPFVGRDRELAVFNPGSIGPRRFHLPIVFGVLELAAGRLSMKHIDCETGAQWLP